MQSLCYLSRVFCIIATIDGCVKSSHFVYFQLDFHINIFFHTFLNCVISSVLYQQHFSNGKSYACARACALIIIKYGKMQCCTDSITDTIPACTSICTNSLYPFVMSFSYIRHISIKYDRAASPLQYYNSLECRVSKGE